MLAAKKRKIIRGASLLTVLALILVVIFSAGYIGSFGYKRLMGAVEVQPRAGRTVPAGDAADPAAFTDYMAGESGAVKVAENQMLALFLTDGMQGIMVADKRTDMIWRSIPKGEGLTKDRLDELVYQSVHSMFNLSHANLTSTSAVEAQLWSTDESCTADSEKIVNGVRVKYSFEGLNLKIAIDFTIEGDRLCVNVEDKNIEESAYSGESADSLRIQMADKSKHILDACKTAQSATGALDYSDSKRSTIDLTVMDIDQLLTRISQEADVWRLIPENFTTITDGVDLLLLMTDDCGPAQEALSGVTVQVTELFAIVENLMNSRSTNPTTLQIIPYFGAQQSNSDGYVFYPDQCGAISYFSKTRSLMCGSFQQDVYSGHTLAEISSALPEEEHSKYSTGTEPPMLPVYGVKVQNSAFVAIIDSGDADAMIAYNPCQSGRDIGNVAAQYYLRKKTVFINENGAQVEHFDNVRTGNDWRTYYVFLAGDKADYSGMAVTYRDYLEADGRLVRSKMMEGDMPVGLDYFMGQNKDRKSIFGDFITMTRYDSIQENLAALKAAGIDNMMLNLSGWTSQSGYDGADVWKPAGGPGGEKGLKSLSGFAGENGYLMSLLKQTVWVNRDGISTGFVDVTTVKSKSMLSYYAGGWHLLNPNYLFNAYKDGYFNTAQKLGVSGLTFSSLGRDLYFDYNKLAPVGRSDTAGIFNRLAAETQKKLGYSVLESPNAYLLNVTDWAYNVSDTDSDFLFGDESVPFYQMVIHGSIPYTGAAYNLMYDRQEQELCSVEFGALPYYFLTEQSPQMMREAGFAWFSSSRAGDSLQDIAATYRKQAADLGRLWNVKIAGHKRISDTLKRTEYENGAKVYVNYGETEAVVDGVTIPARQYKVVDAAQR